MKKMMTVTVLLLVAFLGALPLEARGERDVVAERRAQQRGAIAERRAQQRDAIAERRAQQRATIAERRARPRVVVVRPRVVVRPYGYNHSYGYGGYNGYNGYSYHGQYTGIRFHMELVPDSDRAVAKRGIVTIDGAEQGIVNRFDSWQNGHIPVSAGEHSVTVELEDGRVFQTEVLVQPGQILHVYIRF